MWTLGSFASANMRDVLLVGAALAVGLLLSMGLARDLNAVSAGSDARLLGVNAPRVRLAALVLATLMTAAAVSVSGIIGFVGLTAPHAVRRLTRRRITARFCRSRRWRAGCFCCSRTRFHARCSLPPSCR